MSADRPINADVPSDEGPEEMPTGKPQGAKPAEPKAAAAPRAEKPVPQPAAKKEPAKAKPKPKPPRPPRRKRKPIPGAIKLVVGLVALAIVFIVAVIVGGTGGGKHDETGSAAPAPVVAAPPADESGESGSDEESAAATTELGFPGFATDNTTRVGGSSPAENAAAVALAVFPSTTDAQRPEAVTLVDETDWPAALAAAVLMAPPLRAPLLFSGPDEIPEASQEAWEALDPQGGKRSQGARGFAFGTVTAPEDSSGIEQVRPARGGANDPAAIAAAIAEYRDRLFGSAPAAIVVAPLSSPQLAMPAAAWAARSGDPVLFAEKDKLPEPTAEAISRHTGVPVYVLGPKSAIADQVLGQIKKLGPKVKRVAGKDSIVNALDFARFHDGEFGWNINEPGHGFVLARDEDPLEAAAASALSASGTWGPLLLTDSADTLPKEVRSYLLDMKPGYETNPTLAFYNHVWVIGDQDAIGVGQQAEVNELAEVAKIGGEG